nr:N-6 DNA methylase [Mesorhizobium sp. B2-3-5]
MLNTAAYSGARAFIRDNYFIKAIISLPRNAFEFLARTTAKTSIIILIKKPDASVVQREPVFFAKANTIGYTSTGMDSENDLPAVTDAFRAWRDVAPSGYAGAVVDAKKLKAVIKKVPSMDDKVSMYWLSDDAPSERLDFAYHRMRELIAAMPEQVPLSAILDSVVRIPDDTLVDEQALIYSYAWVRSVDGRVRPKGIQDLKYEARDLRVVKTGDILVSGIDAVRGSIGVVGEDCDGLVVSKEFFIFRIKAEKQCSVDAEYLVRILRSPKMRAILEGTITGVSNRTRMESPSELLKIPIAPLPSLEEQQKISQKVQEAFKAQDDAVKVFAAIDNTLSAPSTPA